MERYFYLYDDMSTIWSQVNIIDDKGMTVLSSITNRKYWLYHVWDYVRVYRSLEEADEGVDAYLRNRRDPQEQVREANRYFGNG